MFFVYFLLVYWSVWANNVLLNLGYKIKLFKDLQKKKRKTKEEKSMLGCSEQVNFMHIISLLERYYSDILKTEYLHHFQEPLQAFWYFQN